METDFDVREERLKFARVAGGLFGRIHGRDAWSLANGFRDTVDTHTCGHLTPTALAAHVFGCHFKARRPTDEACEEFARAFLSAGGPAVLPRPTAPTRKPIVGVTSRQPEINSSAPKEIPREECPQYGQEFRSVISAQQCGRAFGVICAGNPWSLAKREGLTVYLAPEGAELRGAPVANGSQQLGFILRDGNTATIYLNSALSKFDTEHTLCHELGHWLSWAWTEDECNTFADTFLSYHRG